MDRHHTLLTVFHTGLTLLRRQLNEHVTSTSLLHKPQLAALPRDVEAADCSTDMEFDLDRLDGAWPSLWTDGLNSFCVNDNDQDVLNSFLLGLS